MQFESLKAQMDADMLNWAHEASDALSEGVLLARGRGSLLSARRNASAVSARAETFLVSGPRPSLLPQPRTRQPATRRVKPPSRASRPPILDTVVFGYYQLDRLDREGHEPGQRRRRLSHPLPPAFSSANSSKPSTRRGAMLTCLSKNRQHGDGPDFKSAADLGESPNPASPASSSNAATPNGSPPEKPR